MANRFRAPGDLPAERGEESCRRWRSSADAKGSPGARMATSQGDELPSPRTGGHLSRAGRRNDGRVWRFVRAMMASDSLVQCVQHGKLFARRCRSCASSVRGLRHGARCRSPCTQGRFAYPRGWIPILATEVRRTCQRSSSSTWTSFAFLRRRFAIVVSHWRLSTRHDSPIMQQLSPCPARSLPSSSKRAASSTSPARATSASCSAAPVARASGGRPARALRRRNSSTSSRDGCTRWPLISLRR
jgi:hypothetical protein